MAIDIFERVEQLDAEADDAIAAGAYDRAVKLLEEIRAVLGTAISKEVSPTRKKRLQDLSDSIRDRHGRMKRDIAAGRKALGSGKERKRAVEVPAVNPPPPPSPTLTPSWNEAVLTGRAEPVPVPVVSEKRPLETNKQQQRQQQPEFPKSSPSFADVLSITPPSPPAAPKLASPAAQQAQPARDIFGTRQTSPGGVSRRPRTPDRPFGISPGGPVPMTQGGFLPRTSTLPPGRPVGPIAAAAAASARFDSTTRSSAATPPPSPRMEALPKIESPKPSSRPTTPPASPTRPPPQLTPEKPIVFSPRIVIPMEYERDEEEQPVMARPAPATEAVAASSQKLAIESKSVAVETEPEPVKEAVKTAPIVTSTTVPEQRQSPSQQQQQQVQEAKTLESPASVPEPEDNMEDDPELKSMLDKDILDFTGDVFRHVSRLAGMAERAMAAGLLARSYRVFDRCHRVLALCIRKERNEDRLDRLYELDSDYRKKMLDIDRRIKQYGPVVKGPTAGNVAAIAPPEHPTEDVGGAMQQAAQVEQLETAMVAEPGRVPCFKCAKMVSPVLSHSIPDWLACCCPANSVCPDCREPVEEAEKGRRGQKKEKESEPLTMQEAKIDDVEQQQQQQQQPLLPGEEPQPEQEGAKRRRRKPTCPQCNVKVKPEVVNSLPDWLALTCPCFNNVSYVCPQCKGELAMEEELPPPPPPTTTTAAA